MMLGMRKTNSAISSCSASIARRNSLSVRASNTISSM